MKDKAHPRIKVYNIPSKVTAEAAESHGSEGKGEPRHEASASE